MSQRFDTAARGAVFINGRDITRHTKRFSSTENIAAVDDTHMQPDGDAMNYIVGLSTSAISISGSLPMPKALVEAEMRKALGLMRTAEPLLLAPWGTTPGYYAEFLEAEQSRFGTDGLTPNITAYNADFAGTGGLKRGTMLQSSQGTGNVTQNEIKTLTFSNTDPNESTALRVVGTSEVFAFSTTTTNAQFKAGLEALPALTGRTVTVTGAALTGTTAKSGAKTFEFSGASAVPALEIVTGAARRRQVVGGDIGNYSFGGGAAFTLPITQADFDANQKAILGAYANSVSVGSSSGTAASGASGSTFTISGADDVSYNGLYSPTGNTINGSPEFINANGRFCIYLNGANYLYWALTNVQNGPGPYRISGPATGGPTGQVTHETGGTGTIPSIAYTNNTPANYSLDFTTYFPLGVTPSAPVQTGTGASNTVISAPGSFSPTASSVTSQPGGTFTANFVTAAFNGPWIDLQALTGDATTNDGGAVVIEVPYASPACNATVRIQHADDNGSGAPGAATSLAVFDPVTQSGGQLLLIARGTQCKRWVRVAISSGQITGTLAFCAAVCRNPII